MNSLKKFYYTVVLNMLPLCGTIFCLFSLFRDYQIGDKHKVLFSMTIILITVYALFYQYDKVKQYGWDWAIKLRLKIDEEYKKGQAVSLYQTRNWLYAAIIVILMLINFVGWIVGKK